MFRIFYNFILNIIEMIREDVFIKDISYQKQ